VKTKDSLRRSKAILTQYRVHMERVRQIVQDALGREVIAYDTADPCGLIVRPRPDEPGGDDPESARYSVGLDADEPGWSVSSHPDGNYDVSDWFETGVVPSSYVVQIAMGPVAMADKILAAFRKHGALQPGVPVSYAVKARREKASRMLHRAADLLWREANDALRESDRDAGSLIIRVAMVLEFGPAYKTVGLAEDFDASSEKVTL
jgi:hypothetical protein